MYTDSDTRSLHDTLPSFGSGAFSGFFGIGGGFMIVPGIVAATGMPMINAVGTSLVAVTAFGLTTAANYAWSGLVDWQLAALFIAGGAIGSWLGLKGAQRLSARKGGLTTLFALLVQLGRESCRASVWQDV